jgi:hypothetical protein
MSSSLPRSSSISSSGSSSSNKTAVRRASSIALEHKKQLLATNVEEFCNYSRGMIEFQIMALQSELDLLHEFFNSTSATTTTTATATAIAGEKNDSETTAQIETLFHILVHEQEHYPTTTTVADGTTNKTTVKTISSTILAHGLRTVPGNDAFVARLESAALNHIPSNVDLDLVAFETLLHTLVTVMECTLSQLLELLILHVVFVDTEVGHVVAVAAVSQQPTTSSSISINTNAVLPTTTTMSTTTIPLSSNGRNTHGTTTVDDPVRSAMRDRRMKALFKVFDTHEKASVDFKDIVVGLYKVLDDAHSNFSKSSTSSSSSAGLAGSPGPLELEASHAAVNALLLFDETQRRELSYRDFARLMLSIVASLPPSPPRQAIMTFDDLADGLTRNASASSGISETYALQKWSMNTTSKLLLDIRADDENDEFTDLGVVEWSKMERLFAFCDTTKDNRISVKELALTLRYVCCMGMRYFLIV